MLPEVRGPESWGWFERGRWSAEIAGGQGGGCDLWDLFEPGRVGRSRELLGGKGGVESCVECRLVLGREGRSCAPLGLGEPEVWWSGNSTCSKEVCRVSGVKEMEVLASRKWKNLGSGRRKPRVIAVFFCDSLCKRGSIVSTSEVQ